MSPRITRRTALILLPLGAAFAAGCTTGTPISPQQVASIQRGKTTKDEVRKTFGEPKSVMAATGGETWMYDYSNPLQMLSGGSYQQLFITFTGNRVKDYQHSTTKAF